MSYQRITWKDAPSTETPLSAANLNTIEDALDELYNEHVTNVDTMGTQGSGTIARFGPVCMMALTFTSPISIGGETDILQFPAGYIPYLDFNKIVINDATGETVGIARYNASRNMMTFTTNEQDSFLCKLSVTYITDITPTGI